MSDRGVSFAGSGSDDLSGKTPGALPTGSLGNGGPIVGGPETNTGATTDCPVRPANADGQVPAGAGITFAGDV